MKTRLNLTVDENLVYKIKEYADLKHISVSELVEGYFKKVVEEKQMKGNKLMEMVKNLPKIDFPYPDDVDLTKQYYEERASKYGF